MKKSIFLIIIVLALFCACGAKPSKTADEVAFDGESFSDVYKSCSAPMSGCVNIILKIENKGDTAQYYALDNACVNGENCNTGSGVPVTADVGKSTTGAFVIFTETKLADIQTMSFNLRVMENPSMADVEKSETVTITLS